MTVNITKNALNSQIGSNVSNSESTRHALSKLSSGISLPDAESNTRSKSYTTTDSSVLSEKAVQKVESQESNLDKVSTMQKEVTTLDTVQTALDDVSSDLWHIGKQLNAAQEAGKKVKAQESTPVTEMDATDVSVDTSQFEAEREEMQAITDKYLEGIDHTGSELIDYIENFMETYALDISISTDNLGKTDNNNSLSSLKGDIALDSSEASDILAKAQNEIASLQVSTEMHRSNLLNDIGNEITNFASQIERPEIDKELEESIQEVSEILLNNPDSISAASQVNTTQVASLLLS